MKNKKKWIKGIGIAAVIVLLVLAGIGVYLLWGLYDYMAKVPDITPKESVEVKVGQTLSTEDVFDITCKGSYTEKLSIKETDIPDAAVSPDGKELYVGSKPGSICVYISATGEVAEHADEETVIKVTDSE